MSSIARSLHRAVAGMLPRCGTAVLPKLRTLGRVAETVNSSLELDVVLRAVLDTAVEVMEAERGFLMIANQHGQLELTTDPVTLHDIL